MKSLLLLLATTAISQAATLTVAPMQDASLYQDTNGTLAAGADTELHLGRVGTNDATPLRRVLLRFDLSAIPAGSVIQSATLSFTVTRVGLAGIHATTIHRAAASWAEGTATTNGGLGGPRSGNDATWTHRDATQDWTSPGGDFLGIASQTLNVGNVGTYQATDGGLIADVQAWVNSPATNFGWLMRGDESVARSVKVLASREAATGAPSLFITFAPIPEPSSAIMLTSLAAAGWSLRRRQGR